MFLELNDEFKTFLTIIFDKAKTLNKRLFIVGGAVRDYYLNLPVKDFDLILEGNSIDFVQSLPPEITIKSIHKDFGTVKLLYNGAEYDLASTRTENYPYNGCLPVVDKIGVSIEQDSKRRDFSINSMYFEVLDKLNFKLFDPFCGSKDIENKSLCVLHDKSYLDDSTRIFRGMAFKYRFGFDFSEHDKELIKECIETINPENMSYDRLLNVFKKSLMYPFGLVMFKEIIEKKYYKIITKSDLKPDFELIKQVIEQFEMNYTEFADLCEKIVTEQNTFIDQNPDYKAYSNLNKTDLAYYYYQSHDKNVITYLKIKDIKPLITGDDLIKSGYKQGKIIGEILDCVLNYKRANKDKNFTKNDEMEFVKTFFPLN